MITKLKNIINKIDMVIFFSIIFIFYNGGGGGGGGSLPLNLYWWSMNVYTWDISLLASKSQFHIKSSGTYLKAAITQGQWTVQLTGAS